MLEYIVMNDPLKPAGDPAVEVVEEVLSRRPPVLNHQQIQVGFRQCRDVVETRHAGPRHIARHHVTWALNQHKICFL